MLGKVPMPIGLSFICVARKAENSRSNA
jgi:hypothetical protein